VPGSGLSASRIYRDGQAGPFRAVQRRAGFREGALLHRISISSTETASARTSLSALRDSPCRAVARPHRNRCTAGGGPISVTGVTAGGDDGHGAFRSFLHK
jgi:hypothetical protein